MNSETGSFTSSAVFSTGNSPIAPGGKRMFTFQIYVRNPSEKVYLTLRVIAEGYDATTTSLVIVPGKGFDITIVIILSAIGGIVAIGATVGYKKRVTARVKAGTVKKKKGAPTGYVDNNEAVPEPFVDPHR